MKDSNGMKIKSYYAKSVDEAIAKARVELGSDALLLNTRKTADSGAGTGYEVVMGVAGPPPAAAARPAVPPAKAPAPVPVPAGPVTASATARTEMPAEMERLRAQMDDLQTLLLRSAKNAWVAQRSVPEVADVYASLIAAEVDPFLSKDIADRLEAAMATDAFFLYTGPEAEGAQNRWKVLKSDPGRVEKFLRAEMQSRVVLLPRLGTNSSNGAVAALVGPAGGGKTTSLAKLAVAASAQRPVRLITLGSASSPSISGVQQLLKSLPKLAIAYSAVDSAENLVKLVADARKKECVLIDTPGYSLAQAGQERSAAEALAAALSSCGDVDVHLVVPAYMKARDLRGAIERSRVLRPAKLLVTRLDETETFGNIFSEVAMAGLALSFLSQGPRIPDDIRAATSEDLMALVRERPRARAQAAGTNRAA